MDGGNDDGEGRPPGDLDGAALRHELAALRGAVEAASRTADKHRRAVERLHDENQLLRRGEADAFFSAARTALIRHHDQLRRQARQAAARGDAGTADLLAGFADDTVDILERVGVETVHAAPGDSFDSARHQPAAVADTADPDAHDTLAEVRTGGFAVAGNGRVLKKADVVVARVPPATPEPPPAPAPREDTP
ncbi:nucleotide exchange factor GrpE [Uniformispora flossi]|uniref:nucleotide exchange factor GrpE n=1 Tax=Uniformispora flossi TaxID=3390723 RepID=UPI003C30627C